MQIHYTDKDGGEHTLSFHEDDFEEAMLHAMRNGAETVTDSETMETFDLRDGSKVEGIVHEGVHFE